MPKVKRRLCQSYKILFCPNCGKRFANKTRVLQHMNQPSESMVDICMHRSYLRRLDVRKPCLGFTGKLSSSKIFHLLTQQRIRFQMVRHFLVLYCHPTRPTFWWWPGIGWRIRCSSASPTSIPTFIARDHYTHMSSSLFYPSCPSSIQRHVFAACYPTVSFMKVSILCWNFSSLPLALGLWWVTPSVACVTASLLLSHISPIHLEFQSLVWSGFFVFFEMQLDQTDILITQNVADCNWTSSNQLWPVVTDILCSFQTWGFSSNLKHAYQDPLFCTFPVPPWNAQNRGLKLDLHKTGCFCLILCTQIKNPCFAHIRCPFDLRKIGGL